MGRVPEWNATRDNHKASVKLSELLAGRQHPHRERLREPECLRTLRFESGVILQVLRPERHHTGLPRGSSTISNGERGELVPWSENAMFTTARASLLTHIGLRSGRWHGLIRSVLGALALERDVKPRSRCFSSGDRAPSRRSCRQTSEQLAPRKPRISGRASPCRWWRLLDGHPAATP